METADHAAATTETIVVFVCSELLALPFCFSAVDNLMVGNWGKAIIGFGVAIPVAIIGFTFYRWKKFLPETTIKWIGQEGWKWWVPLIVSFVFIYFLGPNIYHRAIEGTDQTPVATIPSDSDTVISHKITTLSVPDPNSDDTKSQYLGLDDAGRWRFMEKFRAVAVTNNGYPLNCNSIDGVETNNQRAIALWEDFYPLIYYTANWHNISGAVVPHDQPFGITILVGSDSGDAFSCASLLGQMLENQTSVPVIVRTNQVTPELVQCKNNCVEIMIGGS